MYEGALSEVKLVPLRHSLSFVPGRRRKLQAVWPATKPHFWVLIICLFLELALPWGHGFLNGKSSHLFGSHSSASLLHMLSMPCSSWGSHCHWADVTQSWQNDHLQSPCKPQTKKFINMKPPLLLFFSNSSSHGNNKLAKVQCVLFKFFNIPKHFFLCVLKIGSGPSTKISRLSFMIRRGQQNERPRCLQKRPCCLYRLVESHSFLMFISWPRLTVHPLQLLFLDLSTNSFFH